MKLGKVGLLGIVLGALASVGCGPGLGHHGKWAKAPGVDLDRAGTTTLTAAPVAPAASSRLAAARWEEDEDVAPARAPQTWGKQKDFSQYSEEYGF